MLREYDILRVARLVRADRFWDDTEGVRRAPAVGDVATICHVSDPSDPNGLVTVEMGDIDGMCIWLADFAREELELAESP